MGFRALRVNTANTEFRRVREKKKPIPLILLLCGLSFNEIA